LVGVGQTVINSEGLDVANRPAGAKPLVAESRAHVLGVLEENVTGTRMAIAATSDEAWRKKWTLSKSEKKMLCGECC
jgi:hypothetical protein